MKGRPWTKREADYVRRHYATKSRAEMARRLGRSEAALKTYCTRFKLVRVHRWPPADKRYVRENAHRPATEVARELGRPLYAVYRMRDALGLTRKRASFGPDFRRFLLAKHALGWSDAEIAAAWGCERHAVGDYRERLGLPTNRASEHLRERVRRKTAEQLAAAGVESLGELRAVVLARRAREAGWPDGLTFREVQMLNALWDRGPMTRRQIADAIGMPWKGSRKSLVGNVPGGSYLAHLQRLGLVVRLGRIVKVDVGKGPRSGQGKSVNVYSLPLTIQRRKVS